MKYVYLLNDTVHEIIPENDPVFPSIPITARYSADFLAHCVAVGDEVAVERGWQYMDSTFVKPIMPEPEDPPETLPEYLDAAKAAKQAQNKAALADWLAAHPLTWTDGNVYGVTEEDQNEMSLNLAQYQLAVAAEQPAVLEWHAQKQQCHSFTIEEYTALSLAIAAYVYPYRRYQETVKEAIYAAESKEGLDAIEIDYGSVGGAA